MRKVDVELWEVEKKVKLLIMKGRINLILSE